MIYIILLQFTRSKSGGAAFSCYIAKTRTVTEQTTKTANASTVTSEFAG
jgi:hypothetical protein